MYQNNHKKNNFRLICTSEYNALDFLGKKISIFEVFTKYVSF